MRSWAQLTVGTSAYLVIITVFMSSTLFNTNIFEKCIFDVLSKMSTLLKMLYVSVCVAAVCGSTC